MQTLWAWFFIIVIAFRYIPNSVVTRPVGAVFIPLVQEPFYKLPYNVRLGMGWLALLGIVFGSAFGFPLTAVRPPYDFSGPVICLCFASFAPPSFRRRFATLSPCPTCPISLSRMQEELIYLASAL